MSIYDPPDPPESKSQEVAEANADRSADTMTRALNHVRFLPAYDGYWDQIFGAVSCTDVDSDTAVYKFEFSAMLTATPNESDGMALAKLLRRIADSVEGSL